MSLRHAFAAPGLVALLLVGTARAAGEPIKSGPQVNEELAGPFEPLNVTGEEAGKKACLYCKNGVNPVAMVFARELTPEVSKLIKRIDACTAKNSGCDMGSFVVFLSDDEKLAEKLK